MAQIRGIKEKQLALAEITASLREIEKLKEFLAFENPTGSYTLSIDKQHKISLICKDQAVINGVVTSYKEALVAEVRQKANTFGIDFEEQEEAILA